MVVIIITGIFEDLINEYLKVMNFINIDYVEIGFRFVDKLKTKGHAYIQKKNFLRV